MKGATREPLDDVFNFLAGRWLVGYKLTCSALPQAVTLLVGPW